MAGAAVIPAAALAAGVFLIAWGWPRPRRGLPERLARLRAEGRRALEAEARRLAADATVFRSPALERLLGLPIRRAAGALLGLLDRARLLPRDLPERLALAYPGMTPAGFVAQKLFYALLGFGAMAAAALVSAVALPVWTWLAGAVCGWMLPDIRLRSALAARRERVLGALPVVVETLQIEAAAGLSPAQAFDEVAAAAGGPLGDGLRAVAADARVGRRSVAAGLAALARREGVLELALLGDAWAAAEEAGAALGPRLAELTRSLRDQQRLRLLEKGNRDTVRMLIPMATLILPVLLVVLLFPAGVILLGF